MLRLALPALFAVALAACTTTSVAEPSDATTPGADPGLHADMAHGADAPKPTVDAGAGVDARPAPHAAADKPAQPYNCQAPLVVIEEVSRWLSVVGTHATRSAACVDGPGQRVTIDEILVCPLRSDGARRSFGVTYRVTTWDEGGCRGKCPPVEPAHTFHRLDVAFVPTKAKDGYVIEPAAVAGLPLDASPVTAAHDGDCYGNSPAFAPRPIPLR